MITPFSVSVLDSTNRKSAISTPLTTSLKVTLIPNTAFCIASLLSISMSVTVGLVVESTVTAIISVVLAAYSSVVDVEVIRVVLSSRTSKLLLSANSIPKFDETVTLKYCPVCQVKDSLRRDINIIIWVSPECYRPNV